MTEWLKVHAWKACVPPKGYRGFESLSLRQFTGEGADLFPAYGKYDARTVLTGDQAVFLTSSAGSRQERMPSGSGPARRVPVNPVRSGRKQRQRDARALRNRPARVALLGFSSSFDLLTECPWHGCRVGCLPFAWMQSFSVGLTVPT